MSHDAPVIAEQQQATVKNDLLSGLTVALALVPEAIAFAFAAGIANPLVGLYAAFIMAICTSVIGGRPGMISGATGAIAMVTFSLIEDHGQTIGLQYLFAAVVLMGILQILFGVFRFGKFIRLVPHPVMLGFVNGLAIIIGKAQFGSFKLPALDAVGKVKVDDNGKEIMEWMQGGQMYSMIGLVVFTMLVIQFFPKLTKKFPAALAGILICTGVVLLGNEFGYFAEGFITTIPSFGNDLPSFAVPGNDLPGVPGPDGKMINFFSLNTLKIIFPIAVVMAAVGLIESLMTLSLIDEMTGTRGRGNKECVGQGVANVLTGFFGGMGGCAMIGQSVINIKSGGRGRLSGLSAGLFLLLIILFLNEPIAMVPMAALTAVMFMVVIGTFAWSSLRILHKVPFSDAFVIVLVSGVTVATDLAVAVLVGVIVSALVFAWKKSQVITASTTDEAGVKTYILSGPLFFGSITNFNEIFKIDEDPQVVHIDFLNSRVYDHSAIEVINKIASKYEALGKEIHFKHLSKDCRRLIEKAGHIVDVNILEDPAYKVADDDLA